MIAENFEKQRHISRLAQTNSHLYTLLNPYLYSRNAKLGRSSALVWAAQKGQFRTAQMSLEHGGNVRTKIQSKLIKSNKTPLIVAVDGGHTHIVRLLLEHGADPNVKSRGQYQPLWSAVWNDDLATAATLLENGAVVSPFNNDRDRVTPLFIAAALGSTKMAELLLRHGASATYIASGGRTALNFAVLPGSADVYMGRGQFFRGDENAKTGDVIGLLIEHGANLDIPVYVQKYPRREDQVELMQKLATVLKEYKPRHSVPST